MHKPQDEAPRKRIAASIIYGGGDDDGLVRCLQSIDPHVDGIFIAFNGSERPTDDLGVANPVIWKTFAWEEDFSKARNQAFDMIPKDEYDWIFWIDTDDTLEGGENIQEMLAELKPETQGVFLRYDYGVDPNTGRVLVVQWRERFMRTDGRWKWSYPIHEVCHSAPGTQYARKDQVWIRHWREKGAEDRETRARNRRILVKAHKENPNEKRHIFYLANEVYAEADYIHHTEGIKRDDEYEAAIKLYQQFLKMSDFDDDAYTANHRIAECYRAMGHHNQAIDADLQGIKLMPHWPDSWVGLATSFMEVGEWEKVRFFADAAIKLTALPDTTHAIEPLNKEYMPFLLRGLASQELGALRMALMDLENAQVANPTQVVKDRIASLKELLDSDASDAPPEDKRAMTRGTRAEKSVAIVNRPSFEVWHPEQERKGGAGGAETCVMKLAPRLADAGWRVAVFGTPGEYEGIDANGVEWWDVREFDATEQFHTIIGSRAPELFDTNLRAEQKLLWMHDVNSGDAFFSEFGSRLDRIDKVIPLSEWHQRHLHRLYDIPLDKMEVIGNGIDPSLFSPRPPRAPGGPRFVYSSSPDRGIDVVLGLWGSIRSRYPTAELHIYYGWEAIDKIRAHQQTSQGSAHYLGQFKEDVEAQLDSYGREKAGIFWHGRTPQAELYAALRDMDVWLYPTYFLETFCITALEMQMAGVLPLVNPIGALDETVWFDYLKVFGYPNNTTFRDEYLARLDEILSGGRNWEVWQQRGRLHAEQFTWDAQAKRWLDLMSRVREPVF